MPEFFLDAIDSIIRTPLIGWFIAIFIVLGLSFISFVFLVASYSSTKVRLKRDPLPHWTMKVMFGLLCVAVPVAVAIGGSKVLFAAIEQLDQRAEDHRQEMVDQQIDELEVLLESHDHIVSFNVEFTVYSQLAEARGDDPHPPVPVILLTEDHRNEVIHSVLTDSYAEGFDVIYFEIVDDPETYGPSNAPVIDRFRFNPGDLADEELDIETILHHGYRVENHAHPDNGCLFFC